MTALGYQISSLKPLLRSPEEVRTAMRRLREIGYRDLQIQWIAPDVPDEAVAAALEENGMRCIGVQNRYPAIREGFARFLHQNQLFGGSDLCISGIPAECFSQQGLSLYAAELNAMAKRAQAEGMCFSFHPIWSDYAAVDGLPAVERLLEMLPDMRLTLCIRHTVKAGLDPIALLERYCGRISIVHCKDYTLSPQGEESMVPTGQGEIDWPPILAACRRTGVRWALAEQEQWSKDPFLCAQESREYLLENGIAEAR